MDYKLFEFILRRSQRFCQLIPGHCPALRASARSNDDLRMFEVKGTHVSRRLNSGGR